MEKSKRKIYEGEVLKDYRELVEKYKTRYAENIAFEYKKDIQDKEIIKVTYADFARDIEYLGTALLNLNLRKKRIAIISPNRYEWCVSYLAVGTSDIAIVPLDKSLPNNEIRDLIIRSKVDAVIFDKKYEEIFKIIQEEKCSNLEHYICMDNVEGFIKYQDLMEKGKLLLEEGVDVYKNIKLNPEEISIILFTSGTTSIAKAVALSQSNICADVTKLSQIAKIYETDRFLSF